MAYKLLTSDDPWVILMETSENYGCVDIPVGDLPLDSIKIDWFDYTASDTYDHIFNVPMEESAAELVIYAKGTEAGGEVTIETTNVTRLGFTVQAPINCRVDFIIGYKND